MAGEYFGASSAMRRGPRISVEKQKAWTSVQKLLDKKRRSEDGAVKKSIQRQVRKLLKDNNIKVNK